MVKCKINEKTEYRVDCVNCTIKRVKNVFEGFYEITILVLIGYIRGRYEEQAKNEYNY